MIRKTLVLVIVASFVLSGVGSVAAIEDPEHTISVVDDENQTESLALAASVSDNETQVVSVGDSNEVYRPGFVTSTRFADDGIVLTGTADEQNLSQAYGSLIDEDNQQLYTVENRAGDSLSEMSVELVEAYNVTPDVLVASEEHAIEAVLNDQTPLYVTGEDTDIVNSTLSQDVTVDYDPAVLDTVNESDLGNVDWDASTELGTAPLQNRSQAIDGSSDTVYVVSDVDGAAAVAQLVGENEDLYVDSTTDTDVSPSDISTNTVAFVDDSQDWDESIAYTSQDRLSSLTAAYANNATQQATPVVESVDYNDDETEATVTVANVGLYSASNVNVSIEQQSQTDVTGLSDVNVSYSGDTMNVEILSISPGGEATFTYQTAAGPQNQQVVEYEDGTGVAAGGDFSGFSIADWGDDIVLLIEDIQGSLNYTMIFLFGIVGLGAIGGTYWYTRER